MTPTAIVAYLALFATVGFLFVLASLLLGRLVRACAPTPQKVETYECGEPAIGPGSVQFDLRFYVVALVFLIFEVEVALFFPPATVFGKAIQSQAHKAATGGRAVSPDENSGRTSTPGATAGRGFMDEKKPGASDEKTVLTPFSARTLALASMLDLGVFFAVLLVGFAYVWRRGDLDWVRATRHPTTAAETAAIVMKLRGDRLP
jgi:NADH-quinone oxidoreductase subunit A